MFLTDIPAMFVGKTLVVADLHIGITRELYESGISMPSQVEKFAKRLNPTYASFHVAIPYTGTAFGDACGIQPHNEKMFFHLCDPSLDYKKLRATARSAYLQFYIRSGYVMGMLKRNPKMLVKQLKLFLRYIR